jgi:phosphate transport system substrate-binding protein
MVRALGHCGAAAVAWPAVSFGAAAPERLFRIGGAGAAIGTMNSALAALALRGQEVPTRVVSHLGSVGSLRAVEQGALDMALISRPLQVDERMRGLNAWEYGRTPFALATSMQGVSGLTRARLAEMIEDPRATWPDGTPVRLVLRPKSDGDFVLLASMGPLVELALERANARAGMVIAITDQEAVDAVARLRGGLGAFGLSLLRAGPQTLVPLALDGVAPTVANVENASYRIVNRMHVATLGEPSGMALELIRFLQSPDGLAMLAQLGHSTRISR